MVRGQLFPKALRNRKLTGKV